MGTRIVRICVSLAVATGLIVAPGAASNARSSIPSVGLRSVVHAAEILRFPGEPLYLPGGVFLASINGAFELWAERRPDGGLTVRQMLRRAGKAPTEVRRVPFDPEASFELGLPRFLHLAWIDERGSTVVEQDAATCFASWDASRTNDSGPEKPTYPQLCGSPLTQAAIWGIDAGWATGALSSSFVEDPGLEDGTYTVHIAIADAFADLFEVPATQRSVSMSITLTTFDDPFPCFPGDPCEFRVAGEHRPSSPVREGPPGVPAGAHGMPDLVALPAFAMSVENSEEDGRDRLIFGANVWNAGPGPLVVEGFRNSAALAMPATQYFYSKGKVSGKAAVGAFEFHEAPDHYHWHFEDFAAYDLLTAAGTTVVKSGKQSFCLAPTDPIDMTVPGAQWQPERIGFSSACGWTDSIWIREVLPAGWGDTYFQFVSGQSLDVTGVPNGEYQVRVVTNPHRNLRETDYSNNVALQRIRLGGRPGARTVTVL